MNNKYWAIVTDNYEDENCKYYFESYGIAKKNLDKIIQTCKNDEDIKELEYDETSCSWFDPTCNEYSTYVYLTELNLPTIHNEIIF